MGKIFETKAQKRKENKENMNFKYKYVELAFRDEETLERELRKLDFLKS